MTMKHRSARVAAIALGGPALVALGAGSASAHVSVTPSSTAAGAYSVLTFSVGHGCEESPTTRLAVQIPEEIIAVTPTVNPGWTIEKKMDGDRVAEVVYTARKPLPDGIRDTIELQLPLPDREGEKVVFPVVQTCEKGETAWTQTYDEGQDEPESPAPFLVTTAAQGDGHGTAAQDEEPEAQEAGTGSDALGWTGVALGALGLLAGGVALVRTRGRG